MIILAVASATDDDGYVDPCANAHNQWPLADHVKPADWPDKEEIGDTYYCRIFFTPDFTYHTHLCFE